MNPELRRFVQAADIKPEPNPWTVVEWLCRPDMVKAEQLMLVRAFMEPGRSHPFHRHPTREEIIYVLEGQAEQWVGDEHRILQPGDMAHIPMNTIHGTYNPHADKLVFLAILGPAIAEGPDAIDVSEEEPWNKMREGFPPTT
jgi:quercetin dioxygenase-like cupin family protein